MPQQLVANVSGHKEFDLAQLMTSSSLLSTIPPPGVSCTWPGKETPPTSPEGEAFEESLFCDESFIFAKI
jgi:hypothetical protein